MPKTTDTPPAAAQTAAAKPQKTVAILSRQANLASAIQAILSPRMPNAKFITVSKMSDLPDEGSVTLAGVGLPNYLPTDRVSSVISINTSYVQDDDERKAQWELLRNAEADINDIVEILGSPDSYKVIPSKRAVAVRADYAESRANFAEAGNTPEGEEPPTPEQVLTTQLEEMTKMRDLAISVSALKS